MACCDRWPASSGRSSVRGTPTVASVGVHEPQRHGGRVARSDQQARVDVPRPAIAIRAVRAVQQDLDLGLEHVGYIERLRMVRFILLSILSGAGLDQAHCKATRKTGS